MEVRYLLNCLLLPPLLQLTLLLLSWFLRKYLLRTARIIAFGSILSLLILSMPVVATWFARAVEEYPPLPPLGLDQMKGEAIVILSGGQDEYAKEFGEPVSGPSQLMRIRYGAYLQKQTGLPVLLSGGSVFGKEMRSLAKTMEFDLQAYGGAPRWLEERSRTTLENAAYSSAMLKDNGVDRIFLVTSALHMKRAHWSFREMGLTVIPAPTAFVDRQELSFISFLPTARSLELSSRALHEWLGFQVYTTFGLKNVEQEGETDG